MTAKLSAGTILPSLPFFFSEIFILVTPLLFPLIYDHHHLIKSPSLIVHLLYLRIESLTTTNPTTKYYLVPFSSRRLFLFAAIEPPAIHQNPHTVAAVKVTSRGLWIIEVVLVCAAGVLDWEWMMTTSGMMTTSEMIR